MLVNIELNFKVEGVDESTLVMMLENSVEYYGMERIKMLRKIITADQCRRREPLSEFSKMKIDKVKHYYNDIKRKKRGINEKGQ